MARGIWSGIITFGLVNIPVKLTTVVRKREIHFHQLHKKDNVRVRYKLVCPVEGKEISRDEIVRGYEIAPDQYVVVEDEELEAVAPEAGRTIDILRFVDLHDIDPIYFDRPYYMLPDKNSGKAYPLFVEALEQAGKVGICKFVMREKEYLAALRALDGVICCEILHFGEEVTMPKDLADRPEQAKVNDRELAIAQQLIDALTGAYDPMEFKNEYIERVEEMIERKAEGEEVVTQPNVDRRPAKVVDLMEALEQSLKGAKKAGEPAKAAATAKEEPEQEAKAKPRRKSSAAGKPKHAAAAVKKATPAAKQRGTAKDRVSKTA